MLKQMLEEAIRQNNNKRINALKNTFTALGWEKYYKQCLTEIGDKLADEYFLENPSFTSEFFDQVDLNPLNEFVTE